MFSARYNTLASLLDDKKIPWKFSPQSADFAGA